MALISAKNLQYQAKWPKFAELMKKTIYIKIAAVASLLLFAVTFTVSKLEIKNPVTASLSNSLLNNETKISSDSENSELNESSSRIYFSIFKFISNLVPTGSKD